VKVLDGVTYSLGGLDLDGYYANNLFVTLGKAFYNTDNQGMPTGGSIIVNMNSLFGAQGDLYGSGYLGFVQMSRIDLHDPLAVQEHQILVPEPATLVLIVLGATALLGRRKAA
jgi:hypothetical protein